MKAIYGEVGEIKELRSTQVCRIAIEVPAESYKAVVAMLHGQKVLLTIAPPIHAPYGVVEPEKVVAEDRVGEVKQVAEPLGALSKWAVLRCKERDFQLWLAKTHEEVAHAVLMEDAPRNEEEHAKMIICSLCGITSRKQLDEISVAADAFNDLIRRPYADAQG